MVSNAQSGWEQERQDIKLKTRAGQGRRGRHLDCEVRAKECILSAERN